MGCHEASVGILQDLSSSGPRAAGNAATRRSLGSALQRPARQPASRSGRAGSLQTPTTSRGRHRACTARQRLSRWRPPVARRAPRRSGSPPSRRARPKGKPCLTDSPSSKSKRTARTAASPPLLSPALSLPATAGASEGEGGGWSFSRRPPLTSQTFWLWPGAHMKGGRPGCPAPSDFGGMRKFPPPAALGFLASWLLSFFFPFSPVSPVVPGPRVRGLVPAVVGAAVVQHELQASNLLRAF